jgi:AcrR family transcriptional regulator
MECPFRCRRKEARPGELIAAAQEIFVEKGFAATRLDDVAARAGVSKGTVYLYFKNKEALFKAVIETGITPAVEMVEALAAETDRPAEELLRGFIDSWWRMMGATPLGSLPKLLVAESRNFPEIARWFHDALVRRGQKALARIVELGVARGEFRAVDADLASRVFFAPMFSYLLWQHAFGDFMRDLPPPEIFFDEVLNLLIHGLAKPIANEEAR